MGQSIQQPAYLAGVKDMEPFIYATCSGRSCNRLGTGLLSAGKLLSKPDDPWYRPVPITVLIRSRYVLQVATSHVPSADTSRPIIGSPRAGNAVCNEA
jgi:hypothetical protein